MQIRIYTQLRLPNITSIKIKLRGLSPRANFSDRRLSAKLGPTFADRGCHGVRVTDPTAVFSDF
jgi:hypothetical protein